MRSRSNSGVRLDYYQRLVYRTILDFQDPVTGLIPSQKFDDHAWVRDNIYCILSVWALSMAYKKNAELDEDRAKTYELEQSCVKLMRGLLMAMMKQKEKIERFKESQTPLNCLHAKYSSLTGNVCVGDSDWGHLQLDATSLFLLILAQMTASGLQIVFNLDEVAFIQNLIFYIESSYYIPDYGIWERGDKTNHGLPELNASSVGMAKAALEAMNELDLFGGRGGPSSFVHVLADEAQKCHAVLHSMLPRESNSKEVDAALLSVIGFPAFAVEEAHLIKMTRDTIIEKLQGQFGCRRFLRDGYKTAKEDPNRLYYEPWELKIFENIECEWPVFFCYFIIDACFREDRSALDEYTDLLEKILIQTEDGLKLVPEMYSVPADKVELEYETPHSQSRMPIGQIPFMWAQSLYVVGRLLQEGFIAPGELDPLNRRFSAEKKPDIVVQMVVLAENAAVQEKVKCYDIEIQTISEVAPIEVQPARVLGHIYSYLGYNKKLDLSGRTSKDVGLLSTSKLYTLQDRIFAFTPQNLDNEDFHLVNDIELFASTLRSDIAVLRSHWRMLGRPIMVIIIREHQIEMTKVPLALSTTMTKLKSGYINGTRVTLGNLEDFFSTSCISSLSFLSNQEEGDPDSLNAQVKQYLEKELQKCYLHRPNIANLFSIKSAAPTPATRVRKSGVSGMIRRSRSIQIDQWDEIEFQKLKDSYQKGIRVDKDESSDEEFREASVRTMSELHLEHVKDQELLNMLKETDSLEEQGDILHFLSVNKGLNWDTGLGQPHAIITVRDMFQDFYERACQEKKWGLVRHVAGSLGKRVEDLAKSMTDLLVRQKQVTVGMPPQNEHTITRPLSSKELRGIIHRAHSGDQSTAMLTQELVVYLSMFIHTEPHLFDEMLRIRVGLIIQVMASELAKSLKCSGPEATEMLLNLSPFEMKTLLHNILSGKEFTVKSMRTGILSVSSSFVSTKRSAAQSLLSRQESFQEDATQPERQGQWLRRRRLDGALNRVPKGFYPRVWSILEKCQGLSVEGKMLFSTLTREMTPGELKFALQVEHVLNSIPQPEYRQLIVEAIMVLSISVEHDAVTTLGGYVNVESFVHKGNQLFLQDQHMLNGDATLCCAAVGQPVLVCNGAAGVCQCFYDSAPSGCYGTMTYLVRAVADSLGSLVYPDLDCITS